MEKWNERFKQLREERGYSQGELADRLNTDIPTISRYERGLGAKKITKNFKLRMKTFFDDDEILYIETGMLLGSLKGYFEVNDISPITEDIDEYTKNKILNLHQGDRVNEPVTSYGGVEDTVSFEYFPEVYASAGGGAMVYESLAHTEPMQLSRAFVEDFLGITTQKNMHILNVKGDSMEPTILDGELIFVLPLNGEGIIDGNIYVMMYKDEIYVKRVRREAFSGTYKLSSDNLAVDDISLTEDESSECQIIGEVVGQMRRRG